MPIIKFLMMYKRAIGIVALIGIISSAAYAWSNSMYERGVMDERIRLSEEHSAIIAQQRAEHKKALEESERMFQAELKEELDRVRAQAKTQIEIREVIKYVETEIEVPVGCDKLADDVSRVLKQATEIVRSSADGEAKDSDKQ